MGLSHSLGFLPWWLKPSDAQPRKVGMALEETNRISVEMNFLFIKRELN